MDYGRSSYMPKLNRSETGRQTMGRKSSAVNFKTHRNISILKDSKKYATTEVQKQVKEKIINVLLQTKAIENTDEIK